VGTIEMCVLCGMGTVTVCQVMCLFTS